MRALVTGAGTGIGRATAEVLARSGMEVVATARRLDTLAGLEGARHLVLDVMSDASVAACAAEVGPIDVLVNNAGMTRSGPLETYPIDLARECFETNVLGPLRTIRAFAPAMRERGAGVIVNVSSVEGRVAAPLAGVYCATKHALEAMSESLAFELGHFGVRVIIIEPGYIAPGMKGADRHPEAGTPYEELRRQWSGADATLVGPGGRPGPELVGEAILSAIEDPDAPLRVPVGADAEMVLAARRDLGDAEFTASMRQLLGIVW